MVICLAFFHLSCKDLCFANLCSVKIGMIVSIANLQMTSLCLAISQVFELSYLGLDILILLAYRISFLKQTFTCAKVALVIGGDAF